MTVFVLTRSEGRSAMPVGVTSNQFRANTWVGKSKGNDSFRFELDQLTHLSFAENGPSYSPAEEIEFPMPKLPILDADDSAGSLESSAESLLSCCDTLELAADVLGRYFASV